MMLIESLSHTHHHRAIDRICMNDEAYMDSPDIVKAQTTLEDRPELERKGETVRAWGDMEQKNNPRPPHPPSSHPHPHPLPFSFSYFNRLRRPCVCSRWGMPRFCVMRSRRSNAPTVILVCILLRSPTPSSLPAPTPGSRRR